MRHLEASGGGRWHFTSNGLSGMSLSANLMSTAYTPGLGAVYFTYRGHKECTVIIITTIKYIMCTLWTSHFVLVEKLPFSEVMERIVKTSDKEHSEKSINFNRQNSLL